MGYALYVRPEHELGVVSVLGRLGGAELMRALRALAFDPAWVSGGRIVWDARYLYSVDLGAGELRAFAAVMWELAHRLGPGRSAVLCRDPAEAAASRLLQLRQEVHPGRELRPFLTWAEAAPWLGVPAHAFNGRALWAAGQAAVPQPTPWPPPPVDPSPAWELPPMPAGFPLLGAVAPSGHYGARAYES